jgi:hypothetical protein
MLCRFDKKRFFVKSLLDARKQFESRIINSNKFKAAKVPANSRFAQNRARKAFAFIRHSLSCQDLHIVWRAKGVVYLKLNEATAEVVNYALGG